MPLVSILAIPPAEISLFRRRLLSWFAKRKRDLPWRRTNDPYLIWLSEIMLQQTRVAAVIPYYQRFVAKFPKVGALARARTETVLAYWAGLGYYSRARNLQLAAKKIVAGHAGQFPQRHEDALALPGIGQYTAAAVLSIAYNQPFAVLDGNVARVLARLGAIRGDLRAPSLWQKLQDAAHDLLARRAPGNWNQAMMELGATVCTPKSPRCEECPVENWCRARKLGLTDELPEVRKKRAVVNVTLAAAVLLDSDGQTLLMHQANADGDLFSRMWQFPALEVTEDAAGEMARYLRSQFDIPVNGNLVAIADVRHGVTYRNIRLKSFLIHVERLPHVGGSRIVSIEGLHKLPISSATRKIARAALAQLNS
jgi:A/G-specific adenine glycosylase